MENNSIFFWSRYWRRYWRRYCHTARRVSEKNTFSYYSWSWPRAFCGFWRLPYRNAVGAIGELGEQTLNVKVFEEQRSYDFQAIAISAILGGGSSKFQKLFGGKIDQLATYIDSKYADDAIKKAIRDEILKEKKAYFEPLGKNTKQSLNKDVENRLYELKKGDKYLINILTKIYDIPIIVLEESFPTKSNKSSNE